MRLYIGAENIISPLGSSAKENFAALSQNVSGIRLISKAGFKQTDVYLAKLLSYQTSEKYSLLLEDTLKSSLLQTTITNLTSDKLLVVISTTKGDLDTGIPLAIERPLVQLKNNLGLAHYPLVISNACTSGVLAINTAANLIRAGLYDHAIVIGIDVLSDFVVFGFQSLFAISDMPCAPFDLDRKGVNLGEACASVVLSKDKQLFVDPAIEFLEGSSSNDANHISGPSRTGEGLVRSVNRTISKAGIDASEIDFISAHGTATIFNDEMEAIAFARLGLNQVDMNSLKGYYGHTLGAAGVLETAVCMQSMRTNLLIKSLGFKAQGTSELLPILTSNIEKEVNVVLKTASGFGGANASLLLKKI